MVWLFLFIGFGLCYPPLFIYGFIVGILFLCWIFPELLIWLLVIIYGFGIINTIFKFIINIKKEKG